MNIENRQEEHATDAERLYAQRLARYTTAMRNEMPDRVPLRPLVAEFVGTYAGFTCQELAHDYEKAFAAARKCAADFDWDAVVGNKISIWTGLTQAIGLRYYAIPGIHISANVGFQYIEPPVEEAFMKPDEYDRLIDDPTAYLYEVWLPRVSTKIGPPGEVTSYENNLALTKGGMAMMQYATAYNEQKIRLRRESGTVSALAGVLKAPMDIIADKLRGYLGLLDDLLEQPEKVLAACEALMPHILHTALTTADPEKNVPIGFWMHRGYVPLISPVHFDTIYWPTLKPIIQELWAAGHQTLFYAEGDWKHHLHSFAELPDRSIVFHIDQTDILQVHEVLGEKFCLSGGVPSFLLGHRPAEEVRQYCRNVIDTVGRNGGYIMDASGTVQNDAKVENMQAMTETTLEYGVYSQGHAGTPATGAPKPLPEDATPGSFMRSPASNKTTPGVCVPWSQMREQIPNVDGDQRLCQSIWEQTDSLGYTFIWRCLLTF